MKIDINQIITRANDEIPEEEYLVMLNASEKQLQAENGFLVATEECDKMPDGTDAYHMYYTDGEKFFHAPSKINLFGWRIFTGTL
jgi:hypothetical protein